MPHQRLGPNSRLSAIPSVGFITAHAVVAAIGEGRQFACGRDFAAWAGMTPREDSSAGKRRTKGVSRQGESRLRCSPSARHSGKAADEGRRAGASRQDRENRLGGADVGQRLRAARDRRLRASAFHCPRSERIKGRG